MESIAKSNANPEAYRDAYSARLVGGYSTSIGNGIGLNVRPYFRHSRMDFRQHFLIGKPYEDNGQDSLGVSSSLNLRAFGSTDVLAGIDLEMAQGFLKETQPGPATDGPPPANIIRPAGKHYDYEVDSSVIAGYLQATQPIGNLQLTGGVRAEYVEYDYDNRMIAGNTRDDGTNCAAAGCVYSRPADRKDDFTSITSRVGATYALADNHSLYASVARGYRAPDTSELYRLQRQQSIADLDPERIDSIEVGVRGDIGPVRYSVAAFVMEKDNVIFRDANAFNVSDGRTDHEGVEYELAWTPIDVLTLSAVGSFAKHTYDFNATEGSEAIVAGRDVDTAPRHIHAARVDWRFLPGANAELEWQSIGSYWVDAANAHDYGGHDLLNLRVGYGFLDNWQATLRINNLADREYADRADFAFGSYRYFPGRGRSAFVEVSYQMK